MIADMHMDNLQRIEAAEKKGNRKDAAEFRKLAARTKRLMDKNGITIR